MFPLRYFFSVDPETAAGTPVIDYIDDEPFSCQSNQASPPLITRYRPFSSLLFLH